MRPVHAVLLAFVLAMLAPGGAAARVGVTRHAIDVPLLHERTLERRKARAQPVRDQATKAVRRALAAFARGVGESEARVVRAGDPLVAAVSG